MRQDVPESDLDSYLRRRTSASDYIFREARDAGVRLVRCLWADLSNMVRGRSMHVAALRRHLIDGLSIPAYSMGLTMMDALANPNLPGKAVLVPDPATFRLAPYAPNTAIMIGELFESDQQPWALCPRSFLKRMLADLADAGLYARVGIEMEFYFGTRANDGSYIPIDDSAYSSSVGMTVAAKVINEIVGALDEQRVGLEHYHPESGHGQQELALSAVDALAACDRIIFTRETVRAVAWAHGWYASFAPKPFEAQPGSGLHIHLSLLDRDDGNVMQDGPVEEGQTGYPMQTSARQFLAGVLRHLPALAALSCPTVNSYRRLQLHAPLSSYTAWGYDNLHTMVRQVPMKWEDAGGSAHLEFKLADPSANPYLALGGLIAAGLDGISKQMPLTPPVDVSPHTLAENRREEMGIEPLPASLGVACDNLENDAALGTALGAPLLDAYLAVKRQETKTFEGVAAAAELARHFWKF